VTMIDKVSPSVQ